MGGGEIIPPMKYDREKSLVEALLREARQEAGSFEDPNAMAGVETGVDVLVELSGRRVGIQVTELDTGGVPGTARANENKLKQETAALGHSTYMAWSENKPANLISAVAGAISRKARIAARHAFAGLDEVWLLVSCGVPDLGAIASTFVMTPWLTVEALDQATKATLSPSRYHRAFIHPILSVERCLYDWNRERAAWSKLTTPTPQR